MAGEALKRLSTNKVIENLPCSFSNNFLYGHIFISNNMLMRMELAMKTAL